MFPCEAIIKQLHQYLFRDPILCNYETVSSSNMDHDCGEPWAALQDFEVLIKAHWNLWDSLYWLGWGLDQALEIQQV